MKKFNGYAFSALVIVIMAANFVIMLLPVITSKKGKKYMLYWEEKDESGREGHCRHNGILTDSGYLFIDTVYNHDLKKKIIQTTLVNISETK